jgi:hypothetical protein
VPFSASLVESPRNEILLYRHADTAWREIVLPWLERGRGQLERAYVVVPTRGQAHGWKQRCLREGVGLLGVEFLSPGLARKKWLALSVDDAAARPALGRELLLMGLRTVIERRLQPLAADEPQRGFLKSLQSDPEGALDDFDELLKAGFRAAHFPPGPLVEIFTELTAWVEGLGYDLAARQAETVALGGLAAGTAKMNGRLLVHGLGAELWGEFFNVAAFVRCFDDVTVGLPQPEFRGRQELDEAWIGLWEKVLAVPATSVDAEEIPPTCEAVAELWIQTGLDSPPVESMPQRAGILVGRTRVDEMTLVANEIVARLVAGAENIGVIFPTSDAAHLRLARLLGERAVPFVDQLETAGAPPLDVRAQRALLEFIEGGGRLEELLALWPLLRALGRTTLPLADARDVCSRLFDERQTHVLVAYRENLDAQDRPEWKEVRRVAGLLPDPWPAELTLAEALKRFGEACTKLELELPQGWRALDVFAERETRPLPARVVFATLASFLPEKSPVSATSAQKGFARVTLTTRRRAEGLTWSDLFLVETNAGVWPERREPAVWLTDERRAELNRTARPGLGVFTSEDRATLEKRGYAMLARDTRERVVFSAALFDEEEPELKLAPNSWLERVLWNEAEPEARGAGLEELFERRVQTVALRGEAGEAESAKTDWLTVWRGRRDGTKTFDDFFFCVDPAKVRPERLAARVIERAIKDPAELWFGEVLGAERVAWEPFVRERRKVLGQLAHRVMAVALRPTPLEGRVGERPALEEAQTRLAAELVRLRALWPDDRYWESFHAELGGICRTLLAKVYELPAGTLVAVELSLPRGATVPLGASGQRLEVFGRLDLVLLDRTEWRGARVDVVDFKTGGDTKISAAKMARDGSSLQLGVYLAAAQSLGADAGRVWMVKPDGAAVPALGMEELDVALAGLERLGRQLATGRYGALTPERSPYAFGGYAWPLACAPVPNAVLRAKFVVTFGEDVGGEEAGDE